MSQLQELNDRFRIPGVAELVSDRGGLPALWIQGSHASHGAAATIYLHGAHLASWRPPHAHDVLWLSAHSHWLPGKPIRGGVPLCFPWFGPHPANPALPAHGFARLRPWTLEAIRRSPLGLDVSLTLRSDDTTRTLWPHDFILTHHLHFLEGELAMSLELTNTGRHPLTAELAQHTYFSVGDVRQARITGLEETHYLDKTDGMRRKPQTGPVTITGETDRIYLVPAAQITIEDPVKSRRILLHKTSQNAVVWNPWIDKARAMTDFGDDEWPAMLCVETANLGDAAATLPPGESHTMGTTLKVQPM